MRLIVCKHVLTAWSHTQIMKLTGPCNMFEHSFCYRPSSAVCSTASSHRHSCTLPSHFSSNDHYVWQFMNLNKISNSPEVNCVSHRVALETPDSRYIVQHRARTSLIKFGIREKPMSQYFHCLTQRPAVPFTKFMYSSMFNLRYVYYFV